MSDDAPRRAPLVTIVDAIAALPADQVGALITALGERLGVPDPRDVAPPYPIIRNPPWIFRDPWGNPPPEVWRVRVEACGADRRPVMHLLRERLGLTLGEVKAFADGLPRDVDRDFPQGEARELADALRRLGATADVRRGYS